MANNPFRKLWVKFGSGDMFGDGRGAPYSINHITAPYGLTLTDLVTYRLITYTNLLSFGINVSNVCPLNISLEKCL